MWGELVVKRYLAHRCDCIVVERNRGGDACAANGILPYYGPFGDIKDTLACEDQFRNAFLLGCVGAWSLHPVQIGIAKKVFSPDPEEVRFAKKVLEAIPDGRGVHMIDGKIARDTKHPEPVADPRKKRPLGKTSRKGASR